LVADAVHAPVHADEVAAPHPRRDLMARHTGFEELRPCNDAVSATGNPRQFLVDRPT
jgi:hypothetical protein